LKKVEGVNMLVGLTGEIGSGKSTVAEMFGKYDDVLLHITDGLAKKAISTPDGQDFIKGRFGEQYIVDGSVDYSALGKLVFSNEQDLMDLEAYSHPIVESWVKKNCKPSKINIIETAILFEKGWDSWMDSIIYVTCHSIERKQRLLERGMTEEDIQARQKFQVSVTLSTKIKKSAYHIDNTLGLDVLARRVEKIMADLK